MNLSRPVRHVLLAVIVFAAAIPCTACPVCYGAPDSPATQGVTAAVFSLLGVTGGVLAAFVSMFLSMRRRIRSAARATETGADNPGQLDKGV